MSLRKGAGLGTEARKNSEPATSQFHDILSEMESRTHKLPHSCADSQYGPESEHSLCSSLPPVVSWEGQRPQLYWYVRCCVFRKHGLGLTHCLSIALTFRHNDSILCFVHIISSVSDIMGGFMDYRSHSRGLAHSAFCRRYPYVCRPYLRIGLSQYGSY